MSAPRWMRVLLAVSLGINLLIAGIALGVLLRHGGSPPPRAGFDFALPYVGSLDREDRRTLLGAVRSAEPGLPMTRAARRARYDAVVTALRAQPFDRAALAQLVSAQAQGAARAHQAAQAAWLDLVSGMDDAERSAYADRVEARARKKRKKKH